MLKRHHIGEIASKIGQLYYQYYLRTSNTAYLTETYCFYYAIRCRGYYNNAKAEKRWVPLLVLCVGLKIFEQFACRQV